MKKTFVKWLALSLALCCLIPLFAGCSIFEDKVTRTAKKIVTGGNFTVRVEDDDDSYSAKVADGAYMTQSEDEKYICYYDEEAEKYKAYSRKDTDGWEREDFSLYGFGDVYADDDFGLYQLYMFINFPDAFTKTDDGVYTYKDSDGDTITIKSAKTGLKVTEVWTSGITGKTYTTTYSFTNIGKTVVDIPDAIK